MKEAPKRQAPECSMLHKISFFLPLSSLPAAPPLFFSFSFYPSLRAAAFESVCAECLGRGPGGEKASVCISPHQGNTKFIKYFLSDLEPFFRDFRICF